MATTFALHIDCDPLWIYAREYGLSIDQQELIYRQALPQFVETFARHGLPATFFVVGKELEREDGQEFFASAVAAGHALANHTYSHLVDFSQQDSASLRREIVDCDRAIREHTGFAPRGFRGPGYFHSAEIERVLKELNYLYDSSVLPGPAALMMAAYLRMKGEAEGKSFGAWENFWASSRPKRSAGGLVQLPIAVMPYARLPVHTTFIYKFGIPYLDFALRLLASTPGHHILLFHAIDLLDYPNPERFSKVIVPLSWSYGARQDLVDHILEKVGSQVVLSEKHWAPQ
jgi:hypothetical protein